MFKAVNMLHRVLGAADIVASAIFYIADIAATCVRRMCGSVSRRDKVEFIQLRAALGAWWVVIDAHDLGFGYHVNQE